MTLRMGFSSDESQDPVNASLRTDGDWAKWHVRWLVNANRASDLLAPLAIWRCCIDITYQTLDVRHENR